MTAHNHSQLNTTERQLPGVAVGALQQTELADWALVQKCKDGLEAIQLCVQLSGYSSQEVARQCGIDKGNFTRMMQGRANFPDRKRVLLMRVCRNYAPLQYEALACDFELLDKTLIQAIRARAA
jgi:hypothetical protein